MVNVQVQRKYDELFEGHESPVKLASGVIATPKTDGTLEIEILGQHLRANAVGAQIWRKLAAGEDVQSVIDSLAEQYGIPRAIIAGDTKHFLEVLADNLLIDLS